MTNNIENLRSRKFVGLLEEPLQNTLRVFSIIFLILAIAGFLMSGLCFVIAPTIPRLYSVYLIGTSAGCLIGCMGFLIMRRKVMQIDRYQEEMVQAIYDTLEKVQQQFKQQEEHYKDLQSRLNTLTYMTFRHSMCPDTEQLRSFIKVMNGDLTKADIDEDLRKTLDDFYVSATPLIIIRESEFLSEHLLGDDKYWSLFMKLYPLHPLIAELDIIPDLLNHVLDSIDNNNLPDYETK